VIGMNLFAINLLGLYVFMGFLHRFQKYFSFIIAASFIGRGNQSTLRKSALTENIPLVRGHFSL